MSYIDQTLMPGERVVYRARVHWSVFFPCIVFGTLLVACIVGGIAGAASGVPSSSVSFIPLLFIVTVVTGLTALARRSSSEFAVTDKRVLIKVGLISRRSLETLLAKVEGIQVAQGLLGRLFGYGTIAVTGTGGSKSAFHNISEPLEFRQRVQQQIEALGSGAGTQRA